jgi:hypothetical protein
MQHHVHIQPCSSAVLQRRTCALQCHPRQMHTATTLHRPQHHAVPLHGVCQRGCGRPEGQLQWRHGGNIQLTRAGGADDLPAAQEQFPAAEGAADDSGNGAGPFASVTGSAAEQAHSGQGDGARAASDDASGSTANSPDVQHSRARHPRSQRQQRQRDVLAGCKRLWRSQTSSWRRLSRVRHMRTRQRPKRTSESEFRTAMRAKA